MVDGYGMYVGINVYLMVGECCMYVVGIYGYLMVDGYCMYSMLGLMLDGYCMYVGINGYIIVSVLYVCRD